MDGIRFYKFYMAVRLHFQSEKYNVFENGGRIKCSIEAFNARADKNRFIKMGLKFKTDKEAVQYIVSNFVYDNNDFIYTLDSDEYYTTWIKRKQSITQIFKNDLEYILDQAESKNLSKSDIINFTNVNIPLILSLLLANKIAIETVVMLNNYTNFLTEVNQSILLFYSKDILRIKKSKGFINYDNERVKPLYDEFMSKLESVVTPEHKDAIKLH